MSLPNRIAAYDDCFRIFEQAISSAGGTRVCFATHGEAHMFMMRMHQARSLERTDSQRMYPKDDIRWGKSEYDKLIVRHPREDFDGRWWIYVEFHGSNILAVEPIEPAESLLQLTGPTNGTDSSNSN